MYTIFENGGFKNRNTWVTFLNASLEMHVDVTSGRQLIRLEIPYSGSLVKEYKNPPCNSLITTSCFEVTIASSSYDCRVTAPFAQGVSSFAEEELDVDDKGSAVSLAPSLCVVPDLNPAVTEGDECFRNFRDHLSDKEGAMSCQDLEGEAADDDIFVVIMSGLTADGGAALEFWTFTKALERAKYQWQV